jgi:hypothetical protein
VKIDVLQTKKMKKGLFLTFFFCLRVGGQVRWIRMPPDLPADAWAMILMHRRIAMAQDVLQRGDATQFSNTAHVMRVERAWNALHQPEEHRSFVTNLRDRHIIWLAYYA